MRPISVGLVLFAIVLLAIVIPVGVARQDEASAQRLAYVRGNAVADVVVADADGSQGHVIVKNANVRETVVWSPDGSWLATTIFTDQRRNIVRISTTGTTNEVLTSRLSSRYEYGSPNWSPHGDRLTSIYGFIYRNIQGDVTRQFGVHLVNADGMTEQSVTHVRDGASVPTWSPDGEWIAYVSRFGGLPSIFRVRPDGSQREQLTEEAVAADFPEWSPDGRWITFFAHSVTGLDELRLMQADGSGMQVLYQSSGSLSPSPSVIEWSPNGQQIAFHARTENGLRFFVIYVDTRKTRLLVNAVVTAADWSPDGEWIAYTVETDRLSQVYRIRPDGTGQEQLTVEPTGARFPQYAPIVEKNWSSGWLVALFSAMLGSMTYWAPSSFALLSKLLIFAGSMLSSN